MSIYIKSIFDAIRNMFERMLNKRKMETRKKVAFENLEVVKKRPTPMLILTSGRSIVQSGSDYFEGAPHK